MLTLVWSRDETPADVARDEGFVEGAGVPERRVGEKIFAWGSSEKNAERGADSRAVA